MHDQRSFGFLASGAIDGVVGMYDDGREERNPKGK